MNENQNHERDEIQDLLVEAGPPTELPEGDLAAIRRAARREWVEMSSTPTFEGRAARMSSTPIFEGRASRALLAVAASLVLLVTAVWLYRADDTPVAAATIATIEILRAEPGTASPLGVGDELVAGAELTTERASGAPARMALRMASGHSVRLDADSKLVLASATRLELERGAVYVDSGTDGATPGLEIVTALGSVREIGTQFEVRVNGTVRVRVREGSVALSRSGRTFSASHGEQLMVDARGEVDRSAVAIAGTEWAWVQAVAPGLDIEGVSVETYLGWISRETGWPVRYENAELEAMTAQTLHGSGSLAGLSPEQSLGAVLPSSGLGYRVEGGTLVITKGL